MVNIPHYDEIKTGDKAEFSKTISEVDIYLFAGISGDFNPVHINAEYAAQSFFKQRIAHGMLSAALISTVIGTCLPGPGTIYLEQTLQFRAPVFIGDTITAEVEVIEKIPEKKKLRLKTTCHNQGNTIVISGEALVMFDK